MLSTARAVLSIAYNLPYPVMDGNVARVIARLEAVAGGPDDSEFKRAVVRKLDFMISLRQPGAFNQSLMELGQTVCLPRSPRCHICPVHKWCRARRMGRAEAFPAPKTRRKNELRHLAVGIIVRRRRIALLRGLDDGLLPDMWNFPSAFGPSRAGALRNLKKKLDAVTGAPAVVGQPSGELRHNITFRTIRIHVFNAEVMGGSKSFHWVPISQLRGAAISQLARKITDHIARHVN